MDENGKGVSRAREVDSRRFTGSFPSSMILAEPLPIIAMLKKRMKE